MNMDTQSQRSKLMELDHITNDIEFWRNKAREYQWLYQEEKALCQQYKEKFMQLLHEKQMKEEEQNISL